MPPKRTAECNLSVADCNRTGSPDPDAFLRCDEHFVGRLDFKGVVPDVCVSSGSNHTKLAWGMRVAYDLLFDIIVGDFSAPGLGPPEKDALVPCIAVAHRRRLSSERSAIGVERKREAAEVRDVLAHRQFSVYMDARNRCVF